MKTLTPEQKKQTDERKAAFRQMVKTVAEMSDAQREQLAAKMLGLVSCEGHAYSQVNRCLIAQQRDAATVLGGFRQWLNQGRAVRRGERGLMIWVPIVKKGEEASEQKPAIADELHFTYGTVFDVSQTEEVSK